MQCIIYPDKKFSGISPVSCRDVKVKGFFQPYLERNRRVSIPLLYKLFEKYGTIENFRIAAGVSKEQVTRRLATDSDLYKWMEAISWDLQSNPDEKKEQFLDDMIGLISRAQESSGYIDTYYIGDFKHQRFKNLQVSHELYCGGHLIQSAIAHFRSTGKNNFLDVAIKWTDFIVKKYYKNEITQNDGHPEIEMALVELYRTTGERNYLKLAGKIMEMPYIYLGNKNFLKMKEIMGHAVRMMYLMCGATDYYIETRNKGYYRKIKCLSEDLFSSKYYITGGIGSRYDGEAFGFKYELPNLRAYCETCASVSLMMWLYRMFFVQQDAKYFDLFERVLYNAFLASVSLDGKSYFYVNPLESNGFHRRKQWYQTTCCPPNFQRFIASLPAYFYAVGKNEIWINLYDKNQAKIKTIDGNILFLDIETSYPWNGKIKIDVKNEADRKVRVHLRIPYWSDNTKIKYKNQIFSARKSSYFTLEISGNSSIDVEFDIKSETYLANPAVTSDRNSVSICRGPLVYCLEGCDNDFDIFNLSLPYQSFHEYRDENFHNIIAIYGYGFLNIDTGFLYRKGFFLKHRSKKIKFKAIPYFSWANRKQSSMTVWINKYENKKI